MASVKELTTAYNDLALRKQIGQRLNEAEEAQLQSLETKLKQLKLID